MYIYMYIYVCLYVHMYILGICYLLGSDPIYQLYYISEIPKYIEEVRGPREPRQNGGCIVLLCMVESHLHVWALGRVSVGTRVCRVAYGGRVFRWVVCVWFSMTISILVLWIQMGTCLGVFTQVGLCRGYVGPVCI